MGNHGSRDDGEGNSDDGEEKLAPSSSSASSASREKNRGVPKELLRPPPKGQEGLVTKASQRVGIMHLIRFLGLL